MARRGRRKSSGGSTNRRSPFKPDAPVPEHRRVDVLLKQSMAGQTCQICGEQTSLVEYKKHVKQCRVRDSDSDIEVVDILTAEQARKQRRSSINLTNDDQPICREKPASTRKRSAMRVLHDQAQSTSANLPKPKSPEAKQSRTAESRPITSSTPLSRRGAISCFNDPQQPSASKSPLVGGDAPESTSRLAVDNLREVKVETDDSVYDIHGLADRLVRRLRDLLECDPAKPSSSNVAIHSGEPDPTATRLEAGSAVDPVRPNAPYNLRHFWRLLLRVLSTPTRTQHRYDETFWGNDLEVVAKLLNLDVQTQKLFVRVFLRPRRWIVVGKMKQTYDDLENTIEASVKELLGYGLLENEIQNLDETLRLLDVAQLRDLAKLYKLDPLKGKLELIKSITAFSQTQRSVLFGDDTKAFANRMQKAALKLAGSVVRLPSSVEQLFISFFVIYTPTEWNSIHVADDPRRNLSAHIIYIMYRLERGEILFPAPRNTEDLDLCPLFESKQFLYDYVSAMQLELKAWSFANGQNSEMPGEEIKDAVVRLSQEAQQRLGAISAPTIQRLSALPSYHRKFSAAWILVRTLWSCATQLERLKSRDHSTATLIYRFLLETPHLEKFCSSERGEWWDRLALILHSHCKRPEDALNVIQTAAKDPNVPEKWLLALHDRLERLVTSDELPAPWCPRVQEPDKLEITGTVLAKNLGDSRVNRFVHTSADGTVTELSVEAVALGHYIAKEGFDEGVHAEGAIWHLTLGLLFYRVIFANDIDGVWLSELQTAPVDHGCGMEFWRTRETAFRARLEWLEKAADDEVLEEAELMWKMKHAETNAECAFDAIPGGWPLYQRFLKACPRDVLVAIFRRMLPDYRNCRSGFPDLTIWSNDPHRNPRLAVVEVKGPGDRLSTKQRLWLDYFKRQRGVSLRAECCWVSAVRQTTRSRWNVKVEGEQQ